MYFSKCWRDTRFSFLSLLVLVGAATLLWTILVRDGVLAVSEELRADAFFTLIAFGTVALACPLGVVAGLVLGSKGLGAELKRPSSEFLFTRPCTRGQLLRDSLAMGILEILFLLAFSIIVAVAAIVIDANQFWNFRAFRNYYAQAVQKSFGIHDIGIVLVSVVVIAIFAYCFTQLVGILTRSGRKALAFGGILILAYSLASLAAPRYGDIQLPSVTGISFYSHPTTSSAFSYEAPIIVLIGLAVLSMICVLVSGVLLNRSEI